VRRQPVWACLPVWTCLALAVAPLVICVQGCGSGVGASADGGLRDGGRDAPEDVVDARSEAPVRVAITRGLLPTAVENLLLDPFVTYDDSWGHFYPVGAVFGSACPAFDRELVSQSPVGIAGVVVKVTPGSCSELVAPMSGTATGSVRAQVWISLSDADGAPLPFPPHDLDALVKVELMPNYLASQTPQPVYALDPVTVSPISPSDGGSLPMTIAGRQWGLVAATGIPFPQGGWFAVTATSGSLLLAGPEVVSTDTVALARGRSRPMTDRDREVISEYRRVVHTQPAPRRRTGAH
jgi:hypothetical protein